MATQAQLEAAMAPLSADALAKALADSVNALSSIKWVKGTSPSGGIGYGSASGNYLDLRKMSRTELQFSAAMLAKWMDESEVLQKEGISSDLLLKALLESPSPKPPFWPWVLGGLVLFALYQQGQSA